MPHPFVSIGGNWARAAAALALCTSCSVASDGDAQRDAGVAPEASPPPAADGSGVNVADAGTKAGGDAGREGSHDASANPTPDAAGDGGVANGWQTYVQAWTYAGECHAALEYADGRVIHTLKPGYFTIDETAGTLMVVTEDWGGAGGYTPANAADVRAHSVEQYATVAGPASDGLATFLGGSFTAAIQQLVQFTQDEQFTGIELDFEGMSAAEYQQFLVFASDLATSLHAAGKKLMVDGPGIPNEAINQVSYPRYEDLDSRGVDVMVVMAYDDEYDTGVGNPITPIAWLKQVTLFAKGKVSDPSRLVVGLPSYGYSATAGDVGSITTTRYIETVWVSGFAGATRDDASAEMVFWPSATTVDFYQDSQSMNAKREAAESLGIGGVSVWHLGGDLWFCGRSELGSTSVPACDALPYPIPSANRLDVCPTTGGPRRVHARSSR